MERTINLYDIRIRCVNNHWHLCNTDGTHLRNIAIDQNQNIMIVGNKRLKIKPHIVSVPEEAQLLYKTLMYGINRFRNINKVIRHTIYYVPEWALYDELDNNIKFQIIDE